MRFIIFYFLIGLVYSIFYLVGPNDLVKTASNLILLLCVLPFPFYSFKTLRIKSLPYFYLILFLFVSSIILAIGNAFRLTYSMIYNEYPFENPPYNIFWFSALILALFLSILFLYYFKNIILKSKVKNYAIIISLIFFLIYIFLIYSLKEILFTESLIAFLIYYGIGGITLSFAIFYLTFFLKGEFSKSWAFIFLAIILAIFGRISFEAQFSIGSYYPGSYTSLFFALSYLSLSIGSYKIYRLMG